MRENGQFGLRLGMDSGDRANGIGSDGVGTVIGGRNLGANVCDGAARYAPDLQTSDGTGRGAVPRVASDRGTRMGVCAEAPRRDRTSTHERFPVGEGAPEGTPRRAGRPRIAGSRTTTTARRVARLAPRLVLLGGCLAVPLACAHPPQAGARTSPQSRDSAADPGAAKSSPLPASDADGTPFQQGLASYYSPSLAGRATASGEPYDPGRATAAHRRLPFGTIVRVERLDSSGEPAGASVRVRINDRGPFVEGRIIDLSGSAARELGIRDAGVVPVRLEILSRP